MVFVDQEHNEMKFLDYGKLGKYKNGEPHDADEYVVLPQDTHFFEGTLDKIAEKEDKLGYIFTDCKLYKGDPTGKAKVENAFDFKVYVGNKSAIYRQMIESKKKNFIPAKEGDVIRLQYNGLYKTKKGGTGYAIRVLIDRDTK